MMNFFLKIASLSMLLMACGGKNTTRNSEQAGTGEEASLEARPEPAKRKIIFFGNSLTAAYGLEPEQGFPALIQQKIDSLGLPYTVVNAGLSGETTAGGNERVDWVLQQGVDIFVLELGGNDGLRGIDPRVSRQNLQSIIDKVKGANPGGIILLAGMEAPPNMGQDYTRTFREMYPALARENELPLLPFLLEGVGGHPGLNLPDGIHPNEEGQKIVARNVWEALLPLLKPQG